MNAIIINEDDLCLGRVDIDQLIDLYKAHCPEDSIVIRISKEDLGLSSFGLNSVDRLYVAGDDSTVNKVVNFVYSEGEEKFISLGRPKIGIIPCGVSNNIAEELYKIIDPFYILKEFLTRQLQLTHVDVIKLSTQNIQKLFIHMVDIGLKPSVRKKDNMLERNGRSYFYSSLITKWLRKETSRLSVSKFGETFKVEGAMYSVANTKMYGKNAPINKEGDCADGKFEFLTFGLQNLNDNPCFPWELALTNQTPDWIRSESLQRLALASETGLHVQVDGESIGTQSEMEFTVCDFQVPIMIPISA